MIRVAVLDDYQGVALEMAEWGRVGSDVDVQVFRHPLEGLDKAAAALAPFDVVCLMRERMPVPRTLIERLPNLKLIVVTGGHNRTLDLDAAAAHGIVVSHTRGGESQFATPELAWGLILACARHIPHEDRRMRAGRWQETIGTALCGQTLGIVGLGRIGSRMAVIGGAFGMKLLAWSQNLTPGRAAAAGATLVPKEELLAQSDVITIHVVLGERTRGLIGRSDFALMKPSAILVNTARGPIIDEAALLEALSGRRIRAAGLDVYDEEPLPADHPLHALDNAVLTPHLGYVTEGTYRMFYQDMVEDIAAWRAGAPIRVLAAKP